MGAFILLSALSGCSSQAVKPLSIAEKPVPDWFLNPPQDNATTLFGAGEGTRREEAIQAALVDLVAKLSVEVESSFESQLTVKSGRYDYIDRVSQKQIRAQVAKIRVNQYQVMQVARLAYGRYLALVQVKRQQLFEDLSKQQQSQKKTLSQREAGLAEASVLSRFLFYQSALQSLAPFRHRLLVMEMLDPAFDSQVDAEFLARFERQQSDLKAQLRFHFEADEGAQAFVAPLQNSLVQAGFQVVKSTRPGTFNAQIRLISTLRPSQAYGFYIVRVGVQIQVEDTQVRLGGNQLHMKGQSTESEAQAMTFAGVKFQQRLEAEGLNAVLGLALTEPDAPKTN